MARAASGPLSELSVEAMRAGTAGRVAARPRGPDMHEVRDLRMAGLGLGARLYRPTPAGGPLLVFFHGGGWTIGSLDTHDRACRRLAAGSEAAVLSIDYRLAPEHPWPASVDDAVGSVRWAAENSGELNVDGAIGAEETAPAARLPHSPACVFATSTPRPCRTPRC